MTKRLLPLAYLPGFAIAAYALVQLLGEKHWVNFAGWFLAAAVLHDLVFLPAYSAAGQLLRPLPVRIVNHVRVPALISGLLLLVYFPLITGLADSGYQSATGHHPSGYLRKWLLITLALFAGSAVVYIARAWRR